MFSNIIKKNPNEKLVKIFIYDIALSFDILHHHAVGFLISLLDVYYCHRYVFGFDNLYAAIIVAIIYLMFYLFVLEQKRFYAYHILLSPRPHWCLINYSILLAIFPGIWYFVNKLFSSIE